MVYIVDDDPAIQQALERLMRSAGLRAETFASVLDLIYACRSFLEATVQYHDAVSDGDSFKRLICYPASATLEDAAGPLSPGLRPTAGNATRMGELPVPPVVRALEDQCTEAHWFARCGSHVPEPHRPAPVPLDGIGGIEVHILQLATAQRALGWRACVVARPDSWLAEQAASAGIDVMPLRMRGFWDVSSTVRLFSIVRKQRPAVLHGHAMRGSHYARLSRRWLKGSPPLVQSAHSTHSWKHFDPAAPVICVSEAVAEALRARGFRNLRVIYNGIPEASQRSGSDKKPSMWRRLSERKRSERLLVLLQVGRFIPDKAQDWTLAQLASFHPSCQAAYWSYSSATGARQNTVAPATACGWIVPISAQERSFSASRTSKPWTPGTSSPMRCCCPRGARPWG
jgi:hypothetical protein